jgi:tRNA A-37 threonylcarbamoyl transferase component Bud32
LLLPDLVLQRSEQSPTVPAELARQSLPTIEELAKLFPHLEILELLGQGGMGAVYKARQIKLDRFVALKILPPAVADDRDFAERFAREARALAKLSHPNIVGVHDFGQNAGLFYLMMEFVDGVNLRQAIQLGKLRAEQALSLVRDLCDALQYAHDQGVVHRDIKPENILLDRKGKVKVVDFGLAKIAKGTTRLTGTQQVMGTPHYMAPEQVEQPTTVDHRADIYSLGVVFYEMLTGQLPMGKFEPPSEKSEVNERVDEVVLRAMEREPNRRYQQMTEMKSAVDEAKSDSAPAAQPAPTADASVPQPQASVGHIALLVIVGIIVVQVNLLGWFLRANVDWSTWDRTANLTLISVIVGFFVAESILWRRVVAITGFGVLLSYFVSDIVQQRTLYTGDWIIRLGLGAWFWLSLFVDESKRSLGLQKVGRPPMNFTENEEEVWVRLRKMQMRDVFEDALFLARSASADADDDDAWFDGELLAESRKSCEVPPDANVVAILRLSDDDGFVVFTADTLYFVNPENQGKGQLSLIELRKRRCVNHGDRLYLGDGVYVCPDVDENNYSCDDLAELLAAAGGELTLRRVG